MDLKTLIKSVFQNRVRFNLREISGGFGDLGTFIPLAVPMVIVCGMDAGSVLFWAGLAGIAAGFYFGLPVPVQPMKAIAAVAIAGGLTAAQVSTAGMATGIILLVLCTGSWMEKIVKVIPAEIVRGIQVGVGLKLIVKSFLMFKTGDLFEVGNFILLILCGAVVLAGFKLRKLPAALIVFVFGLGFVFITSPDVVSNITIGWSGLHVSIPALDDWVTGFIKGSLVQLPLTILNSVIAVCALSGTLFPGKAIGEKKMALSVSFMNLTGCMFGALPMCHGSGGLASQYRFGGRTGGSPVIIGSILLVSGVLFGASAIAVMAVYPQAVLGILLLISGMELGKCFFKNKKRNEYLICAFTGILIMLTNTFIGFAAGMGLVLFSAYVQKKH